ncbi:MAG: LysR family transcriptional regulator [Pseudomonadota bacterium]
MNINSIDLNLLKIFDAVMSEGNVTRASQRLYMSQPAVSHALNRLRHTLKDELFVKASSGVRPTPRAQELAGPVNLALSALAGALQTTRFDPENSDRVFRIATHDYLTTVLMANLARYLKVHAPKVRIQLKLMEGRALEMLDQQEADLAISAFGVLPARFESRTLIEDKYVVVMRSDHPLARQRLTVKRYAAASHLLVSPRGDPRGFVDTALARLGLTRHVAIVINQFSPAAAIVQQSDLLLTVPERIAKQHARSHDLRLTRCPVASPESYSITSMVWHSRFGKHPAHDWLRDVLLKVS